MKQDVDAVSDIVNTMNRDSRHARGFSIIEVLVAIFLLGVVTTAVTGLITLGTRIAVESERQTVAQAIVNERIEYARSLAYSQVGYTNATGQEPDGVLERQETVNRNQQSYEVTTVITLIDDAENGDLPVSTDLIEANADYKQVEITASWNSASGTVREVDVATLVAAGGNLDSCTPGVASCPDGSVCPANGVCHNPNPLTSCPSEAYFCGGSVSVPTYITTSETLYAYQVGSAPQRIDQYSIFSGVNIGGNGMLDIAMNSAGRLYGITDDDSSGTTDTVLYEIDKTTAATSDIGDVDETLNATYDAAGFLADGRLVLGGPDKMKFVTLSSDGNTIEGVSELDLTYSVAGEQVPVQVSGDLIQRDGGIWFIGHFDDSGDYCMETNTGTGVTTVVSGIAVGAADTVWGAVCEADACDLVRVFMKSGITKVVDAETCVSFPGEDLGQRWEGATK